MTTTSQRLYCRHCDKVRTFTYVETKYGADWLACQTCDKVINAAKSAHLAA